MESTVARADNPVVADGSDSSHPQKVSAAKADLERAFERMCGAARTEPQDRDGSDPPEVSAAEMVGMMEQLILAREAEAVATGPIKMEELQRQLAGPSSFLAALAQASEAPTNWWAAQLNVLHALPRTDTACALRCMCVYRFCITQAPSCRRRCLGH